MEQEKASLGACCMLDNARPIEALTFTNLKTRPSYHISPPSALSSQLAAPTSKVQSRGLWFVVLVWAAKKKIPAEGGGGGGN
jgi:hypothetical protein